MSTDALPSADLRAPGRLDALPGSLGKVSLCAAMTLGVAAFVSVRRWLAARASADDGCGAESTRFGLRGKAKPSHSATVGSSSLAKPGAAMAVGGGGGGADDGAGAAGVASSSPPPRPQLPQRNYFTIRASLHVKRHNAKMMEWADEQLGVQLLFSPQFFELKQEERQAPLILLSFRTVREATHRVAVTIEELYDTQTAGAYCEASLGRIADCARVLGTSLTRIGSKEHPSAEYCYIDETQTTVFVFSVFVVSARLAVTLQYVAPTRVRNVMPTAFYDLTRCLAFTAPSPSPSYLLVSEPRLGLGYHLPLDFLVHEGLAESDGVEDRLFTSTGGGEGPLQASSGSYHQSQRQQLQHQQTRGVAQAFHRFQGMGGGEVDWVVPYATAMSRGGRRMGLITSYEPSVPTGGVDGSGAAGMVSFGLGSSSGSGNSVGGGNVPYMWRAYLEQQVCKAVRQLGLVLGSGHEGPRVIFQAPDPADAASYANAAQTLLMEPYPLSVVLNGNFSAGDDGREEDGAAVNVTAFSLFREVRIDVNSSYVTLVPDTLDAVGARMSGSAGGGGGGAPETVKAFWSAFYVPVGTACVSFHFIASALRHTSTEFVSFCAAVMNSVSLGNHYGQAVSVMYCNTRHDVLPFRLSLPPTGMATVEEPMLADPLCIVQSTYGVEKFAVTVRVFPLFTAAAAGQRTGTPTAGSFDVRSTSTPSAPGLAGKPPLPPPPLQLLRPAERRGTRRRSAMRQLQQMVRYYLSQFPGGVHIVSCTKTTVNAMPALLLCFRPTWYTDDGASGGGEASGAVPSSGTAGVHNWEDFVGGGGSSQGTSSWADTREAMLEDEVGQLNPFAQYFAPPPPPASYLWPQQQGSNTGPTTHPQPTPPVTAAAMRAAAGKEDESDFRCPRGGAGDGGDSQRSREELDEPLRVAVAVCCEGNAFLFQTAASEYTLGIVQQAVQTTATYLALIPRGT